MFCYFSWRGGGTAREQGLLVFLFERDVFKMRPAGAETFGLVSLVWD
jgi:hypothetical protein